MRSNKGKSKAPKKKAAKAPAKKSPAMSKLATRAQMNIRLSGNRNGRGRD